ncbi:MAG TPA: ferritin-like domain-containing protein, partial [Candidatus Limnocylindrales bacterium]|nr:ferritin-like domain-containing protein [Candidatus Limnocylindrales bacterium]
MTDTAHPTTTHGRLAHVLAVRSGEPGLDHEAPMAIEHREALIYTLGKAAELEHLVMCQYLYAAFSLKTADSEGLTAPQLETVKRWRTELLHIGEQEMLHLA